MNRDRRAWLRVAVAGLVILMLALLSAGWLLRAPRTAITRGNAGRIEAWMTKGQVEAILGGPARDETTGKVEADGGGKSDFWDRARDLDIHLMNGDQVLEGEPSILTWQSDDVRLEIMFGPSDRVVYFAVTPLRRVTTSPLQMIQRWLVALEANNARNSERVTSACHCGETAESTSRST